MQPIHGFYLYELGAQLNPVVRLGYSNATWRDAHYPALTAIGALGALLNQSVYQLRTCQQEGAELLSALQSIVDAMPPMEQQDQPIPVPSTWAITEKAQKFETVLKAELGVTPMFYVPPKHNADMAGYINAGHLTFPPDLATKVPEAIPDAQQAAKCIAFDLPTAAGFHLHRANESVVRRYFDLVAGAENRPATRNLGDYLNKLSELKKGDTKVRAALRDLKDLHRNPLMHPEEHIASSEDAISLLGGVRAVMSLMLKELPEVPTVTNTAFTAILQAQSGDTV